MSETGVAAREGEIDGTTTEYDDVPVAGDRIERLTREVFTEHWAQVTVGPLIQGAAFEIRFTAPPKVTMLDGYLTVNTGPWHFHLCVNDHTGTKSPELARIRRVARAAFYRGFGGSCVPSTWGVRLWNGRGEQMISLMFPNPHYDEEFRHLKEPRWGKTRLWEDLRARYRGADTGSATRAVATA